MRSRKYIIHRLIFLALIVAGFLAFRVDHKTSADARKLDSSDKPTINQIVWETCSTGLQRLNAKCGKLEVFEDRAAKTGRQINLNLVVIPAADSHRQPDPIFFFSGGPGQGAVGGASLGPRLTVDRDQVFIDQRGTGLSNPLNCPEFDDARDLSSFFGELFPLVKMRQCREEVEKRANPIFYTTSIAMEDIDDVRAALGYDKINLYGTSYGTQAAQVYLRQYPQHVRTAVLAGVAPLFTKLPLQFARGAQEVLNNLINDCDADADCHKAFPNLRTEFTTLLARFDKGPIRFEMTNPYTQNKETVTMIRGNFVTRLLSMIYTPGTAARIPFLIHKAFEGDLGPFALFAIRNNAGTSVSRGMYFTVTCSEAAPFITEKDIEEETKGTFLGDYRTRSHVAGCKEWPSAKVSSDFIEPVKTDVPVLMLSGLEDPATPYWLGKKAVQYMPNGRQILFKKTGHGFGDPCIQGIATEFIQKGSAKDLNVACADQIKRRPFMITPIQ